MEVRFTVRFNRDLAQLRNRQLALQVNAVIDELKAASQLTDVAGVSHLTNVGSRYRIRIRNHRLVFLMEGNIAYLERLLARDQIYGRRGRGRVRDGGG